MKHRIVLAVVVLSICAVGRPIFAQRQPANGPSGIISESGSSVIEKDAEFMRMHVEVQAKGDSLEAALAALKERIAAARTKLGELGADKESLKIGDPQVSTGKSEQQRQMEMMIAQRLPSQGRNKPTSDVPTPVRVTAALTAQWKLSPGTPEELLRTVHPLQEKIRKADIGGTKAATAPTPEEQELQEEVGGQGIGPYGADGEQKPGEADFVFTSRISDDEYDAALAKAFQDARRQAARLAKAADTQLGTIRTISNARSGAYDWEAYDNYNAYNNSSRSYQMMQRMQARAVGAEKATEAIGPNPGKIKYSVVVSASFNLTAK